MEQSCRLYYIFVIFGYTICKVEAGLLDPIQDILNPTAYSNQPQNGPYQMAMQFIPQFQGNNLAPDNTNFRPRDTRVPNRNSNVPYGDPNSSRLFYNNQINSRLPPDHPSNPKIIFDDSKIPLKPTNLKKEGRKGGPTSIKLPAKHPSEPGINFEDKTSSRVPSHNPNYSRFPNANPKTIVRPLQDSSNSRINYDDNNDNDNDDDDNDGPQPVERQNNGNAPKSFGNNQNLINGTTQDQLQQIISDVMQKSTPDSDKMLGQTFPEAEKLLEALRKLNELKKQRKQQEQQKQHKNTTSSETTPTTATTIVYYNNDSIKELLEPIKGVDDTVTPANQMKIIMKKLTKKKFYSRAQPVRPENERRHKNETVYYID